MAKRAPGVEVDFTGVESGGTLVPEGNYTCKVIEVTYETGENSGQPYLKWKHQVATGPAKGGTLYDNTSLQPQALWKLKGLLECMGIAVPAGKMKLMLPQYVGKTVGVEVMHEEYQGKTKARIASYLPPGGGSGANPPATDEDEVEEELAVGSKTSFKDDETGKTLKATVTAIAGDTVTVKDENGDEWDLDVSDLIPF